jgi:hypothetical protein
VLAYLQTDDRGREIAMYEMTTFALRRPGLAHVAQRQYAAYRELAAAAAWKSPRHCAATRRCPTPPRRTHAAQR